MEGIKNLKRELSIKIDGQLQCNIEDLKTWGTQYNTRVRWGSMLVVTLVDGCLSFSLNVRTYSVRSVTGALGREKETTWRRKENTNNKNNKIRPVLWPVKITDYFYRELVKSGRWIEVGIEIRWNSSVIMTWHCEREKKRNRTMKRRGCEKIYEKNK